MAGNYLQLSEGTFRDYTGQYPSVIRNSSCLRLQRSRSCSDYHPPPHKALNSVQVSAQTSTPQGTWQTVYFASLTFLMQLPVMSASCSPPSSPVELAPHAVNTSSVSFHTRHLFPPASFQNVNFVILDPAQLPVSPSLPSCPSRLHICSSLPVLLPVLPAQRTSPPPKEHTTVMGWHHFILQGLEGLDGSCVVLEPTASHLAFGLRNLRPAKTALCPRASSILERRQSCTFQPNSPWVPTPRPTVPTVPHELVIFG